MNAEALAQAAAKCAGNPSAEACVKAYVTQQAIAYCTAQTGGVGSIACSKLVPLIVDKLWPIAWGAASASVSAVLGVLEGIGEALLSGLGDAWDALTGGGAPFDQATAVWAIWAQGNAILQGQVDQARIASREIAESVGLLSVAGHLEGAKFSKNRAQFAAIWTPESEVDAALASDPAWVGRTVYMAGDKGIGVYDLADCRASAAQSGKSCAWSPGAFYLIGSWDLPIDLPIMGQLAVQAWQDRSAAIPRAILSSSVAMVGRAARRDRPLPRAGLWVALGAGAVGLGLVGWSVWQAR